MCTYCKTMYRNKYSCVRRLKKANFNFSCEHCVFVTKFRIRSGSLCTRLHFENANGKLVYQFNSKWIDDHAWRKKRQQSVRKWWNICTRRIEYTKRDFKCEKCKNIPKYPVNCWMINAQTVYKNPISTAIVTGAPPKIPNDTYGTVLKWYFPV